MIFCFPGRRVVVIAGDIDIPIAVQPVKDFVLRYDEAGRSSVSQLTATQRQTMSQWPAAASTGG